MTTCTRSALSMVTDFFSSDDIEATARRTGFVKRAAKLTGKLCLALVTLGSWSDATTTLAPWAAKVTPLDEQVEVSPEAMHQRMHQRALAFLQDMIRQALAKVHSREKVCDDGRCTSFSKVSLADSTGFALPESLHDLCPGSGGSAAKAGAKIHAVWDYTSSVCGHCALTPWHMPDQKYVDHVVAFAHKGVWCIFALGDFTIHALARRATAGAYFFTRRKHQTTIFTPSASGMQHVELTQMLQAVESNPIASDICIGAKALVPSRLVAVRMPEPIVNERRSIAKKKAKKKGDRPSQAHRNRLAWNLFISNVPSMMWKTTTGVKAYPIRGHIDLMLKSWKSSLP